MLVNAATGSAKNMVPNRLMATSNRRVPRSWVWASPWTKLTLSRPAAAARRRATSSIGSDRSIPVDRPVGADRVGGGEGGGAAAATDVEDVLAVGEGGGGEQRVGDGGHDLVAAVGVLDPALSAVAVPGVVLRRCWRCWSSSVSFEVLAQDGGDGVLVGGAEPAADGVHGEPAGAVGEQAAAAFGEGEEPVRVRVGGRVAEQGDGGVGDGAGGGCPMVCSSASTCSGAYPAPRASTASCSSEGLGMQ